MNTENAKLIRALVFVRECHAVIDSHLYFDERVRNSELLRVEFAAKKAAYDEVSTFLYDLLGMELK